jgi:methanogenic corrinoid protein MtbC1
LTDEPVPIGAVVAELRKRHPDVSHSSLRFLEREGLIEPIRTPGGHRLYPATEIARIRQIKTWQQQRLSLDEIRGRLARLRDLPEPAAIARQFLDHALSGDVVAARRVVLDADEAGLPLETTFGDVLRSALWDAGAQWEHGEVAVAQEKELSELTRDLIAELSARHAGAKPDGRALLAVCVEGERHELGLRMICGLLRAGNRPVHYLGADVAPRFLMQAVRHHAPAAVLLSVKMEASLRAVKDVIDVLRADLGEPPFPVVVGGIAVRNHEAQLRAWGAIPIVDDLPADSVAAIESLLAA